MSNLKETTLPSNMSIISIIVFIIFSSIITAIMFNYHKNQIDYMTLSTQKEYTNFNKILIEKEINPISNSDIQKDIDKKITEIKKLHHTYFVQFMYIVIAVNLILIIMLLPLSRKIKKVFLFYKEKIQQMANEDRNKTMIIHQQSKTTMISELLNMVAHQWKEPLSQINAVTLNIYLDQKEGILDDETLKKNIVKIENTTQYLFDTIKEFNHFFAQESREKVFVVDDSIEHCVGILNPSLEHVTLRLDLQCRKDLNGYISLFQHIIFSLISNSLDAFNTNNIIDPEIRICTYDEKNAVFLEISDNAGGIANNHLQKIFDLYFSTKKKTTQSGLGLYITKEIIEKNFHGKIKVINVNSGVKFTIRMESLE